MNSPLHRTPNDPGPARTAGRWALVVDTIRRTRLSATAWVLGTGVANVAIAQSLAHEMATSPGGAAALAQSVLPGAEAMRPLRWPAERLDTLGGYMTYHNLILFTFFLAVWAAIQGAKAIRGTEDERALDVLLATGWSRAAVLRDRAVGFIAVLLLVTLGLGAGLALAMAAAGAPDVPGSFAASAATGLTALPAYALGVLVSQFVATARTASGIASMILTALYLSTNTWSDRDAWALRLVSPFHYATLSRPLVPGRGFDPVTVVADLTMAAVLLPMAWLAFARRDCGAPLIRVFQPRAGRTPLPRGIGRVALGTVWSATLARGRVGLLAWAVSAGALSAMMLALTPSVLRAWDMFGSVLDFGSGAGSPQEQYLAFCTDMVAMLVLGYGISQAAAWVSDLTQGRIEVILSAPVSWARLVVERVVALEVGVLVVTLGSVLGFLATRDAMGVSLSVAGLGRLVVQALLLGAAIAGLSVLVTAVFRNQVAVVGLSVLVGASYLIGYLVPLAGWPQWVTRLSIFTMFGHPYLAWPPAGNQAVFAGVALVGGVLGGVVAYRTPKVA